MGLGPSIKMTTLHHYNCPLTSALAREKDIDFAGIIIDGVSEVCDDKIYTAERTGYIAECMRADGAIVAIDGWGNHHVDFVNVIEQIGMKGIPVVALSYIGLQGRLVCSNSYVDTVIDFNKSVSGYESCVVGQNNLDDYDAMKAVALLKNKMRKKNSDAERETRDGAEDRRKERALRRLVRKSFRIREARIGECTGIERGVLTIRRDIAEAFVRQEPRIRSARVSVVQPGEHHFFVNSNLDYSPIACKIQGSLGEGETRLLTGITVMLTGVEAKSGFQPSNIGSSEGLLDEQVTLNQAGTPKEGDFILHVDVLFEEGEGRTVEGVQAAHRICDQIVEEIRSRMAAIDDMPYTREEFYDVARPDKKRVILVKIVSGLGNMYDTSVFPRQPGGFCGSRMMMDAKNMPVVITPNQCRDGAIHSLL